VQADPAEQAAVDECAEILVDSGQGHAGDFLADPVIDRFGTGMAGRDHGGFVDDLTLVGGGEAVAMKQLAKLGVR